MKLSILIVEDEAPLRNTLLEAISLEGHIAEGVGSAEEAIDRLKGKDFDILLTDINLPGKSGLELLPVCRQINPQIYMLVVTAYGTIDSAVQAMKLGAADFLSKPIDLTGLLAAIRVASEKMTAAIPLKTDSAIVAVSSAMKEVLKQAETVAPFKANVLVLGETGTGKEMLVRYLHECSPRNNRPMVAMNCAAIPEQLLEDELFGHVKGAFTGAQTARDGRFEQADGGTLFLDEIGDMNLALQAKLLRVLQESEFEKLGSSKTIKVDVRVVAATSANLEKKIAAGEFRADLYHRLNVVQIALPPLRQRPEDILPIAQFLLNKFCANAGLPAKTVSEEAKIALQSYGFPGNVRQLQNCMERAAIFSGFEAEIEIKHLSDEIKNNNRSETSMTEFQIPTMIPDEGLDFSGVVTQLERNLLLQTLDKTGGNKMRAAKLLNMKRTTLVEKLKRLHIETELEDEAAED